MIETHVNLFDIAVISIMLLSCLFAFYRGLVRELLSLGAWIGAGIVTIYYFPQVAEKLQPHFKNPVVAAGVGTLGIYMIALMGFAILNMVILKFLKSGSEVGMLDNVMGLAFGAFRGAFILSLGFFLITIALPEKEYPEWLAKSITRPFVEKGALILAKAAPDYLKEVSSLQKKAIDRLENREPPPDDDVASPEDEDAQHGYSRAASQQLDRLIDSSGPSR